MSAYVLIEKLASNTGEGNQFVNAVVAIGLDKAFNNAKAIFIKPNLTYPVYKKGVTTRVEFIENLVAALRQINSTTVIYIGEGEGGYNSFSMSRAMLEMGFYELEKNYPLVRIINLSHSPTRTVELQANRNPYSIELPTIFFDEIDFSISCPLPKVHCMTKITLSFKNQWGCLPDVMRLKNHYAFDDIISQVCDKLKFRYAFLDGRYGLDNNGPMIGESIEVNWFAAANSLGAFDMIVSEMMGFKWEKVGHLKAAAKYGYMPKRDEINVIGDFQSLKKKFVLKRALWNYPALIAFHSKKLTELVYLSKWAKLIHDIMYTFRKRPISE